MDYQKMSFSVNEDVRKKIIFTGKFDVGDCLPTYQPTYMHTYIYI